jgi:uncharacterized phage-like protein YoqJ
VIGPIVAGTGHRIDKIANRLDDVCSGIHGFLSEVRPSHVISGMAQGFDQLLAGYARMLGVPWTAVIPFPGQHLRWPQREQEAYHRLLESASEIVIVSPSYEGPWVMQRRNEWMVDRCELLVSCYDGSRGGTRNCLEYAKRVGRVVRSIDGWK